MIVASGNSNKAHTVVPSYSNCTAFKHFGPLPVFLREIILMLNHLLSSGIHVSELAIQVSMTLLNQH